MGEEALMKQKEESDHLLYSMFPKAIADNLIAKQAEEERKDRNQLSSMRAFTMAKSNFGRTLACMHQSVTILFTDIVGFTSMSQSCQPFEVMSFLHNLFTAFDDLVDMDSGLWKVETIGDAFMVAAGLDVIPDESTRETIIDLTNTEKDGSKDESTTSESYSSSTVGTVGTGTFDLKVSSKDRDTRSSSQAALDFGVSAIEDAKL